MLIENDVDRFIIARWAYLVGEPILSDQEYDRLERWFKQEYPDDARSKHTWAMDECPVELLKKYGLENLIIETTMGYMAESIYSVNNMPEFESTFRGLNEKSRLSFKIDGWNTRLSYYNGVLHRVQTRGRSGNNLSINDVAQIVPNKIPILGRVAITGELSIPNDKWPEYKAISGNQDQRASVRSAIVNGYTKSLSFLAFNIFVENGEETVDQYEKLKEFGFESPFFKFVNNYDELVKAIKYMSWLKDGYNYLTDGLVIENSKYQLAIRLGGWEEHAMRSYVTGYEEMQGQYGVFMVVTCKPVRQDGKVFENISVNNIATITENDLQIGSPIAFSLRSSANVVLDVGETYKLHNTWKGRYDVYRDMINNT